jgi:hypothetical protein
VKLPATIRGGVEIATGGPLVPAGALVSEPGAEIDLGSTDHRRDLADDLLRQCAEIRERLPPAAPGFHWAWDIRAEVRGEATVVTATPRLGRIPLPARPAE